jgi:hypothetical protein
MRTRDAILGAGVLLSTLAAVPSLAGGTHSLGMGEVSIAVPDPALLGRDNPAFLGVARDRGFRLGLMDIGVQTGNTAFGLSDYNKYNGAALTEADEDAILDLIGEDGWYVSGRAVGGGPSFAYGPLAVSFRGIGSGGGRIPREVLEVIFDGNPVDETVDFSSAGGEGWAAVEGSVGFGYGLGDQIPGGETAVGGKIRVLRGLAFAGILHSEGRLVTSPDTLYGEADVKLRTATGGMGYALDLGAVHNRDRWNVGVRMVGLLGSMRWDGNPEITHYQAFADADAVIDLDDEDGEDGDEDGFVDSDSTYAASSFATRLPLRLGVGGAYQLGGWVFATDLEHTMKGLVPGEDPWRMSLGVERFVLGKHLGLRTGTMIGGTAGPALTGGMSLLLGPWRLDLDAGTYSTLSPTSPKGIRIGFGTAFIFG